MFLEREVFSMSFLKSVSNSFARTLGRFLFYFIVTLLVYFAISGFPTVEAKSVSVGGSPTGPYIRYNGNLLSGNIGNLTSNFYPISWNNISVSVVSNSPFYVDFGINLQGVDNISQYTYLYFYGFSNISFQSASLHTGPCSNIGNSNSSVVEDKNTTDTQVQSLIPYGFKCSFDGDTTVWVRLFGSGIVTNSSFLNNLFISLYQNLYLTDENSSSSIEDKIDQQIGEQQKTNQELSDMNDNLTSTDTSGADNASDGFLNNDAFKDDSGIDAIISLPLNFIQSLNTSCTPINVEIPFIDTNVSIPCLKSEISSKVPSVAVLITTVVNGFVIYRILIELFFLVKSARNPDDDRIEVLDL